MIFGRSTEVFFVDASKTENLVKKAKETENRRCRFAFSSLRFSLHSNDIQLPSKHTSQSIYISEYLIDHNSYRIELKAAIYSPDYQGIRVKRRRCHNL